MAKTLSRAEVAIHNSVDDAWVIVNGSVYDVTPFLESHPGGLDVTEEHLGLDISNIMRSDEVHRHSITAFELLEQYNIGKINDEKNETNNSKKSLREKDYMIDWSKPILRQVGKLGSKYVEWVHSPVKYDLRLFESDIVEFFSKSPWWIVPLVWIPIIFYICYLAMTGLPSWVTLLESAPPLSLFKVLIILPFGILLWTFLEYCLHRFVFHLEPPPTSSSWITFHFLMHGQHHKVPFDKFRLVFPPIPAALLILSIYIPLAHILPVNVNESRVLLAGALIGYVAYDLTHYFLHHGSPKPGSYFGTLKTYHVAHHFVNNNLGFGISSKLWDIPFGTLLKGDEEKKHIQY